MRSVNNLFDQVWPFERLLAAYRQASKGKRRRHDVASFDGNLGDRLVDLSDRLASGRWRPGPYRSFLFEEHGRRRLISAAPFEDRVVHHAIVNAIEPVWERRFVGWSFANRKGKGTHAAMRHAEKGVRRFRYCLQIDIQRFFPSIDHLVLKNLLARHIRDEAMLDLLSLVIDSGRGLLDKERLPSLFPGDDLLCLARPTGLPIGNQTSQFLANVYLHPLDLAISQEARPGPAQPWLPSSRELPSSRHPFVSTRASPGGSSAHELRISHLRPCIRPGKGDPPAQ